MNHSRRPILQLDDNATSSPARYRSSAMEEEDDDDDDSFADMPTPERLVEQDPPMFNQSDPYKKPDIDDKVANFLAEIDALDQGDSENSKSPRQMKPFEREEESPPRFRQQSPGREASPHRTSSSAYSNMFVKGTPEFVKAKDEKKSDSSKVIEPWPEEPKTDWQQLMDEKTNYPYYWNTETNAVVWEMPPEFSKFLILQKEYEEKVEKGLKEGTLDPNRRNPIGENEKSKSSNENSIKNKEKVQNKVLESSVHDRRRKPSHSEDSSSDSSDSEDGRRRKSRSDSVNEKPSSSTSRHKESEKDKSSSNEKKRDSPDLPDSTGTETKKISPPKVETGPDEESMDFDIDDIDKELEMALERKRKELMKEEEKKKEKESDKDRKKDKDKRRRDDDRREERHRDRHRDDDRRKHGKHRDRDRDRDRDKERDKDRDKDRDRDKNKDKERDKKSKESEELKVPKLTLKERLKMEMELKLEKERRKKKALIEEMMAKELEKTVASSISRSSKRGRDDLDRDLEEPRKRYHGDDDHQSRDTDDFYTKRGMYDTWDRRSGYHEGYGDMPSLKPPPPTEEMLAFVEERRSQVVDYGHGRTKYDQNVDSDPEDTRPADIRDIEMKKLEALQLAELALSKLEFLEVSKKGLSKLQILLIELETRHQDWQAGGLTTNHFLIKLREANWQLEQYEESAAPTGWMCSWDRDYRRYFYTHKQTGKTQWDYPDADDIKIEDLKAKEGKIKPKTEPDTEISSTSDRPRSTEKDIPKDILANVALPPPPPPPAEEHPSVKSLQLMYGSSSESETEETDTKKKDKSESKDDKPPPPPPPLPKPDKHEKHEKHKDKEKKHKSKKKKKEKSKKKEQEQVAGPVGPTYPGPAPSSVASTTEGYVEGPMTYVDPAQAAEMGYSDPQALEAWYAAQAGSEAPVYGQVAGPEGYVQNDQPLEFGAVPEAGYQMPVEGVDPATQGYVEAQEMMSYAADTYKAVPTVYTEPAGAEDGSQSMPGEAHDGLNIEIGSSLNTNAEEKKKKKKEKMGSSNISLKKKQVSSMVQKWQKVKKEVELEERDREIREAEIRRKLAELE